MNRHLWLFTTLGVLVTSAGNSARAYEPPKAASPVGDVILPAKRITGPLSQYKTALPTLPLAPRDDQQTIELTVRKADITIDADDPARGNKHTIHVRTYNCRLVGPTIRVKPGSTLRILLRNRIVSTVPLDAPVEMDHNRPNGFDTTNLHTHGLHVSPEKPADDVSIELKPGEEFLYEYKIPADHVPGTFWYHPHRHGCAAYQLSSGMAGALIVDGGPGTLDAVDEIKRATAPGREQILVFQQVQYTLGNDNLGRVYPRNVYDDDTVKVGRNLVGMQVPQTIVNGVRFPRIKMKRGEVQRWRTIHAGIDATLKLTLVPAAGGAPVKLHEIAVDGLPLGTIRPLDTIQLQPGYRSDFLVQAPAPGLYILSSANVAAAESFRGIPRNQEDLAVVEVEDGPDLAMKLPTEAALKPFALPPVTDDKIKGQPRRNLDFSIMMDDDSGGFRSTINGKRYGEKLDDPGARLTPRVGTAEEWVLTSSSGSHPFHMHVNPFMVVLEKDAAGTPVRWEWRDTYIVRSQPVTIRTCFKDFKGKSVVHCHNLQHEDYGMMQQLDIQPAAGTQGVRPAPDRAEAFAPFKAPDWSLPGVDQKPHRQADFAGRPTVLLFVRGYDCGHCRAQLDAVAERSREFAAAGFAVVAVAPGAPESAADALQGDPPTRPYPFVLLADADRTAFRAYGCHDGRALHGTFVVDAGGVVRWRRVGDNPFMNVEAVLKVCQALGSARR
jgi:FtsP/CotA-like multicopper oxidase with cupredoxin domain/peroxiredoxin